LLKIGNFSIENTWLVACKAAFADNKDVLIKLQQR
jgi:hypothetical protein